MNWTSYFLGLVTLPVIAGLTWLVCLIIDLVRNNQWIDIQRWSPGREYQFIEWEDHKEHVAITLPWWPKKFLVIRARPWHKKDRPPPEDHDPFEWIREYNMTGPTGQETGE